MKKLFVFVGLAAAGAASLHAEYAPGMDSMQTTKIWSASTSLRGFYDDNYNTYPNGNKQGSAGYEVSPSLQLDVPLQQTQIGLKYTYGLYYYQERRNQGNDPYDQTHQVDLWLDHAFTQRVQGSVKDTFAVGQEPGLLNPGGGPNAYPYRVNGNNIANNATVTGTVDWSRQLSTVTTYNNGFYDYQEDNGTAFNPSLAGQFNRLMQTIGTDLQWAVEPQTTALIGYEFDWALYTAGEPIGFTKQGNIAYSNYRNYQAHRVYVGVQQSFAPNLNVSAKVGGQETDYYNQSNSQLTPYANVTGSYTYAPGSYVQLAFQHTIIPSSTASSTSAQSSLFSASVNHQITAKLLGSLIGSVQDSRYYQGSFNGNSDYWYSMGANLTYSITKHFSTELGYNFDAVQSNIPGNAYSRNRVYLGVTATY